MRLRLKLPLAEKKGKVCQGEVIALDRLSASSDRESYEQSPWRPLRPRPPQVFLLAQSLGVFCGNRLIFPENI